MSDYHAALDGKAEGPFSRARVIEMIASGRIAPDTPLWRSGMEDWAPASSLVEFSGHFAARAADAAPPPADASDANRPRLAAASRRLELGRAIDDAVAAFKRAPWRVSLGAGIYIAAAFAANTLAFSRLLPGAGAEAADVAPPIPWEMGLWLVGGIVFGVVLRAGFCVFTLRVLRGEAASLALVFAGLGRAPALAAYALLYAAAVFAGLLFFILPGIVLAVGFSLGFYVIMESRLGALAAMRESWRAVLELGLLRVVRGLSGGVYRRALRRRDLRRDGGGIRRAAAGGAAVAPRARRPVGRRHGAGRRRGLRTGAAQQGARAGRLTAVARLPAQTRRSDQRTSVPSAGQTPAMTACRQARCVKSSAKYTLALTARLPPEASRRHSAPSARRSAAARPCRASAAATAGWRWKRTAKGCGSAAPATGERMSSPRNSAPSAAR